jgi:hypothetical protein
MRRTARYTPESRAAAMGAIAARVEAGVSLRDAALAEDARPETVRSWLRRGRTEQDGPYAEFAASLERARERALSGPEPMTVEEFRRRLEQAIERGSVQAMKLWAELYGGAQDEPAGELAWIDERRRRSRR